MAGPRPSSTLSRPASSSPATRWTASSIEALSRGLERCYRKGRRGFREAFRKPSDKSFHAWRKSAQRHWRHMQLIQRAWPEALSARAGEAKELSRLLGEDHDLAVLLAAVTQGSDGALTRDDIAAVTSLCRSCQAEIRAQAEPRGTRLFAEPADELRRRIEAYWSSACRLAECSPPEERRSPSARPRRPRAGHPSPQSPGDLTASGQSPVRGQRPGTALPAIQPHGIKAASRAGTRPLWFPTIGRCSCVEAAARHEYPVQVWGLHRRVPVVMRGRRSCRGDK